MLRIPSFLQMLNGVTQTFKLGEADIKNRVLTRGPKVLFSKTHVAITIVAPDNAGENDYKDLPCWES